MLSILTKLLSILAFFLRAVNEFCDFVRVLVEFELNQVFKAEVG